MKEEINYKKLGLKVGLELHHQLDTRKLFCECSSAMKERFPTLTIKRKLHVVPSELGKVDLAAQFEYLRDRTFYYQIFPNETCLVETDSEPPHPINQEALHVALQIALLFNCQTIPDELHVMRKLVLDGSNTTSFQRSVIVGLNGWITYKTKKVPIAQICLEEDAAAIVKEEDGKVTYRLNRLGIPLVEISTGTLEGYTPEEIQEIAYLMGILCRSTSKTKAGIGSIRQDINISIGKGARVEIKGVQELGMIAKIIENEVKRQLSLKKVVEETRVAKPDGTTEFTRPLPGANRMYPESDLCPIPISRELIKSIKKSLPEPWTKKLARFKTKLKLSDLLAKEILRSEYLDLFEKIIKKKVEPTIVANTFTNILKDLKKREQVKIEDLNERHFLETFDLLEKKKIAKEAIPEILKYLAGHPQESASNAVKELGLQPISTNELVKIVKEVVIQPGMTREKAVGIVMSKVRGKIDAQTVMKVVKSLMK